MAPSIRHVNNLKRKKKFKEKIGERKKKKLAVHGEIQSIQESYSSVISFKILTVLHYHINAYYIYMAMHMTFMINAQYYTYIIIFLYLKTFRLTLLI